ncbi:MAG: C40 family peptidase [Cyanobacteria bacterium NC_groundwater_1444_Ag_S-0.65um_54_12]|nr:C40 family peptidase [Cyanobacteria bacterium NC_groundwater_1444_Ag_S-0.65um_54_12]
MELPLQLAKKLAPLLRTQRAEVGLAFHHLTTRQSWAHNDRCFPLSDLLRLLIAMAAYQTAERGNLPLAKAITIASSPLTVRELIRRTLAGNDQQAKSLLLEQIGYRALNLALEYWGLTYTRVPRRIAGKTVPITTPSEMVILLSKLLEPSGLQTRHAHELLSFLRLEPCPAYLQKLASAWDPACIVASTPGIHHLAYLVAGKASLVLVILTAGEITSATMAKIAQSILDYYADIEQNLDRIQAVLATEKLRHAPDQRLVAWEVTPTWEAGKIALQGFTSVAGWQDIFHRCQSGCAVTVVDQVRSWHAEPNWAIVSPALTHLRKGPSHAAELVSQLTMGSILDVLDTGAEWWFVRAHDGTLAWVRSSHLRLASSGEAEHWCNRDQLLVLPPLVTLPCGNAGTITLSAGSRLWYLATDKENLVSCTPDQAEVRLPASSCRLVAGSQHQTTAWSSARELIDLALRFLGIPYLWGGASGWGIDCSGLTQLVFALIGIRLPRDSDQQLALAREHCYLSALSELLPADLVFFPGHVGIYLGNGAFLHASAANGYVTINTLTTGTPGYSPGLAERLIGGGRLLELAQEALL